MKKILAYFASIFPHPPKARLGLVAFAVALMAAFCTMRRADAGELTAEAGVQYLRGPAAAVVINLKYDGPGDTTIEPGLFLIGQTPDHRGVMGGQVLIVDGFGRLDLGLGLAAMNRLHEQLGSQLNFALLVRYNVTDRIAVSLRHFSNSGTTDHNTGVDFVTVGWRF